MIRRSVRILAAVAVLFVQSLVPASAFACACGCGIFDVATAALLPTQPGGFAYLELDYLDQNQNWSGTSKAPNESNKDKQLRSGFFTAGVQYMFDRGWGLMAELPYWSRYFKTTDDSGNEGAFTHSTLGDIRLRGVYTGFSSDMSTGLTFGLKLPTGDFQDPNFDRDTAIGTGSTDLLLGLYHVGRIPLGDAWNWYGNIGADVPALTAGGYRPGADGNAVLGAYYDRLMLGGLKLAPMGQLVGSWRGRDGGTLANPDGSGYQRLVLGPGLEGSYGAARANASVGFPVYQRVLGRQLVAAQYWKLSVGYAF